MSCFDKNSAALFAERLVHAHVRTPDPGSGRVAAMLIFKHTLDHKDLFATKVPVRVEISFRRPPHQSRSAALLHERHDVQTGHHALVPRG